MFFLRCAFFLSIVYVSISFGSGALRNPHAFEAAVASEASGVANAAVTRATDWCAERPTRCAHDAARLTAMVETAMAEPVSGGDEVGVRRGSAVASAVARSRPAAPCRPHRADGRVLTM